MSTIKGGNKMSKELSFEHVLKLLKVGAKVTRKGWRDAGIHVEAQFPDENSKMTKPYLTMHKRGEIFPLDLSCESIFAEDWVEVD